MGRVLALDVGEKRVGVAISDPSRTLARPLQTTPQHPRPEHFATIEALVEGHAVDLVLVGHPVSLDGTVGPQARRIARYREALALCLSVPVELWDERYSTAVAEDLISQRRRRTRGGGQSRRASIDAVAACVILQGFLDSHHADGDAGDPLSTDAQSPMGQEASKHVVGIADGMDDVGLSRPGNSEEDSIETD